MNSYDKACSWLFSQLPMYQRQGKAAYKDNLENTEKLDNYFKHPHNNFQSIHVGGTNGKGSVSHMLASILQKAGYKVGLYTSPHLLDFRERIKVNGQMIPKKEVVEWVNQHEVFLQELQPSFFEMTVAMAFDYFSRREVDIAVIEVGMGGRLDSTNILSPILSIITNISSDHTEFLGNTLELIASEKAGIIKDRVPLLIGEERKETFPVFESQAKKKNSPLYSAQRFFQIPYSVVTDEGNQYFSVKNNRATVYPGLKTDLSGIIQRKNLPIVLQSVEILRRTRITITEEDVYEGLAKVKGLSGLHARWEILGRDPMLVVDTAHNQAGIRELVKQLAEIRYRNLHVIFGVVNDKVIDHVLRLLPGEGQYYFTQAKIPRALDHKILGAKGAFYGLQGGLFETVPEAIEAAREAAGSEDLILIAGSTFVVAEAMEIILL
jgi:dihydrofolate synthase/folylpolyglutamate synthase